MTALCRLNSIFFVILRLSIPKFKVFAAFIRKQVGMGALLNHSAAVKHGDLITEFAGGEAVADVNRSLITCNFIEF